MSEPNTTAPAQEATARDVLSSAGAIGAHFATLPRRQACSVLSESGWLVVHGYLLVPFDASETLNFVIDCLVPLAGEDWVGHAAFVQYHTADGPWSFRTVIRQVAHDGLRVDRPTELRPWPAPPSSGRARAVTAFEHRDYVMLGEARAPESGPPRMRVEGELHAQIRAVGQPARGIYLNELINSALQNDELIATLEGERGLIPVQPRIEGPEGSVRLDSALLPFPAGLTRGDTIWLSGLLGGLLCTLPAIVREAIGTPTHALLVDRPTAGYTVQRRKHPRFAVTRTDLAFRLERGGARLGDVFRVVDLSLGGMGCQIRAELPIARGDTFDVIIPISHEHDLRLPARCVFRQAGEKSIDRVGFQFDDLDDLTLRILDRVIGRIGRALL